MTSQLLFAASTSEENCMDYVLQQRQAEDEVCFIIRLPKIGVYTFQVLSLLAYFRTRWYSGLFRSHASIGREFEAWPSHFREATVG